MVLVARSISTPTGLIPTGTVGTAHGSFGGFGLITIAASAAAPSTSTLAAAMRKCDTRVFIVLKNCLFFIMPLSLLSRTRGGSFRKFLKATTDHTDTTDGIDRGQTRITNYTRLLLSYGAAGEFTRLIQRFSED